MMCISLFSYGRPVVVRCKGVQLGGLGWAGSMKIDPRTTLYQLQCKSLRSNCKATKCDQVLIE